MAYVFFKTNISILACISHITPSGAVSCDWTLTGKRLQVRVVSPANSAAQMVLSGVDEHSESGQRGRVGSDSEMAA
jgi:hypothetical protein